MKNNEVTGVYSKITRIGKPINISRQPHQLYYATMPDSHIETCNNDIFLNRIAAPRHLAGHFAPIAAALWLDLYTHRRTGDVEITRDPSRFRVGPDTWTLKVRNHLPGPAFQIDADRRRLVVRLEEVPEMLGTIAEAVNALWEDWLLKTVVSAILAVPAAAEKKEGGAA